MLLHTQNENQMAVKPVGTSASVRASASDNARKHQTSELSTDGGGDWLDASAHSMELSDGAADTDEERRSSGKRATLLTQEHRDERERVRSPLNAALLQQADAASSTSTGASSTATLLEPSEVQLETLQTEQLQRLPASSPRRPKLATTHTGVQTDPQPEQLPPDASLLATRTPHDALSASASHLHTVDLSHSELGNTLNETEFEICLSLGLCSCENSLITSNIFSYQFKSQKIFISM